MTFLSLKLITNIFFFLIIIFYFLHKKLHLSTINEFFCFVIFKKILVESNFTIKINYKILFDLTRIFLKNL